MNDDPASSSAGGGSAYGFAGWGLGGLSWFSVCSSGAPDDGAGVASAVVMLEEGRAKATLGAAQFRGCGQPLIRDR